MVHFSKFNETLPRFRATLPKEDEANPTKIEAAFKKFCKPLKLKENRYEELVSLEDSILLKTIQCRFKTNLNFCQVVLYFRFCYYLGGTADAATGNLGAMSKPLSWGMPR